MTPEKNDKKLTRWLLTATIALLVLVLGLQLWQLFGGKPSGVNGSLTPDSANGPAAPQASEPPQPPAGGVSPGKTAMIEDVRSLNPSLAFDDLAALSAEELEQLYETGAPGLPVGASSAAYEAERYAGTLEIDSVTSETDPELDESPAHYEVELHHPTLGGFTYKIDAYTGEVLEGAPNILEDSRLSPPEEETPASQAPAAGAQAPSEKPASSSQPVTEEAAKNAAFTHAGRSAADVSGLRCRLERKDGRQVYDIEFWVDSTEYDYKIDAATGAVLEAEQEQNGLQSGASAQPSGGFIGEEAAKSAALAHAGLSAADAGYIECKLDEEDGRWIYELEFRSGGGEYDYEIDAATGGVLKAELDR